MKDWLIIIGTILILLILIDGIRRKRNERYGSIKVSRSLKKSLRQGYDEDDDAPAAEAPSFSSELPNGGARVIGQRDPSVPVPSIEKKARARSFIEKRSREDDDALTEDQRARDPRQKNLNLDEAVPMLMESVNDGRESQGDRNDRIEPSFSAFADDETTRSDDTIRRDKREPHAYDETDDAAHAQRASDATHAQRASTSRNERNILADDELSAVEDNQFVEDNYENEGRSRDEDTYNSSDDYDSDEELNRATAERTTTEKQLEPEEVLIINVMANKGEMFSGSELLDIILKCGMRYGSMDIFHRYSDVKGEGALLFSMANMVKPGTFDLDAMDDFQTPGVSLFMTLPINADSMQSFELMVDTAHAIADGLNGELKDEQRSVMTRQTLEHCRQRIRDFERRRLFRRPPR